MKRGDVTVIRIVLLSLMTLILTTGISWGLDIPDEPIQTVRMNVGIIGGGVAAAAASPCPSGTAYLSAWDGDYTADTDKICYASKASQKDGTQNGTVELSTDYGESGTIGLQVTAVDEGLEWAIASDDLFDDAVGTVCVRIYVDVATIASATPIWEASNGNAADCIAVFLLAGGAVGYLKATYTGDAAEANITSSGPMAARTWTTIKYSWNLAAGDEKICYGTTANPTTCVEETSEVMTALNPVANEFVLGESHLNNSGSGHPIRYDYVKIYSTYDATCE